MDRLKIENGELYVKHLPNNKHYKTLRIEFSDDNCLLTKAQTFIGEYLFIFEQNFNISRGIPLENLTKNEKLTLLEYLKLQIEKE